MARSHPEDMQSREGAQSEVAGWERRAAEAEARGAAGGGA